MNYHWIMDIHIEDSADLDADIKIGSGSKVWHLAQIRSGAKIGRNCIIGRGAYIGPEVEIENNVKIQNYALIYDPAKIAEGAFIGPGVVLTNDTYPRSVSPDGKSKSSEEWDSQGVVIGKGASIGARSTILAGVTIGKWALIGAGSVVLRDIPNYGLYVGNPARHVGWVGRLGKQLTKESQYWSCPDTGERYEETPEGLERINS